MAPGGQGALGKEWSLVGTLALLGALAGCASGPPIQPALFPGFSCEAPARTADLGEAPGHYYLLWSDRGHVVVFRVAPHGIGLMGLDYANDGDHISDAWIVDAQTLQATVAPKAWLDQELAFLGRSLWDFKTRAASNFATGFVSGLMRVKLGGNVFDGMQQQPDGNVIAYTGEWATKSNTLQVYVADWSTDEMKLAQGEGGFKAILLGLQFSPDGRYVKTDASLYDRQRGASTWLFHEDCAKASGVSADPDWKRAAILLHADGRHRLAITPFDPDKEWK